MEITCTTCGESKPLTGFIRNKSKKHGVDRECRRCRHIRNNSKETRQAKWERSLLSKYGMTPKEYFERLEEQAGLCAVCFQPETRTNRFGEFLPLSVDHDHGTGTVRGLICSTCNTGIGMLGDDLQGVLKAAQYLAKGNA